MKLAYLLILFVLIAGLPPTRAEEGQDLALSSKQRFEIGEELIVTVYVEEILLGEILAINQESGLMVNFDEVINILDFPINKLRPFYYQGWFIQEDYTFEMINEGERILVNVKGEQQQLTSADFSLEYGDLYIAQALLDEWFGTNSRTDYENLRLVLRPEQALPIQLAKQRKNKNVFSNLGARNRSVRPYLNRGYELFSPQTIDFQTSISTFADTTTGSYSLLGAREIGLHNVNLFATGTDEQLLSIGRLNVSKESLNSDLLGWANATRYEFGDISPVRVGNLDSRRQALGFGFSNLLLTKNENTEVTNFSGQIQQNWDVELYRNGILLAQEFDVQTGRYEFLNIPLIVGNNIFEIVLYGPQGQVERSTIEKILDSNSLKQQPFSYQLSITKDDEVLLRDETRPETDESNYSVSGSYNFSILGNSSIRLGHVNRFGDDSGSLYSLQFSNVWADKFISSLSYSRDSDDNDTLEARLRTSFKEQAFSLYGSRLKRDGITEDPTFIFSMEGPIFKTDYGRLSHKTEVEKRLFNGQDAVIYRNNLGFNIMRANFYNQLEYTDFEIDEAELFGSFGMQAGIFDVFSRLYVNYSDSQDKTITKVGAEFSYPITNNITSQLSINESLIDDNSTYKLELDYRGSWWNISTNVAYSNIVGESFGLLGRINFGGTPEPGSYLNSPRNLSSTGAIVVRAFIDSNGNYTYEPGEALLEGIRFRSKQSVAVSETDTGGKAKLVSLASQRKTDIEIDLGSIDDPFLVPALEGVSVIPRAGFVDMIDFPLLNSGEVDGVARIINNDGNTEVAGYIDLGLFDKNDKLVQKTSAEYDGYFLMTKIPPGIYSLRPLDNEIKRLGLKNVTSQTIEIETSGSFIDGLELTFNQKRLVNFYVASVGEFSSDTLMYAFWRLNKKLIRKVTGNGQPAANLKKNNGKHALAVATSLNEFSIVQICADLKTLSIECDILTKQAWR